MTSAKLSNWRSMGEDRTGGGRARRANPQGSALVGANAVTENGKVQADRAKVKVSFKHEGKDREETRPPTRQA